MFFLFILVTVHDTQLCPLQDENNIAPHMVYKSETPRMQQD